MRLVFAFLCVFSLGLSQPANGQTDFLPIQEGKSWGYINIDGNVVITPQFDAAYAFSNGAAKVQKNGKNYLINKKGKRISPIDIDDFRHVQNRIIFTKNQKVGVCDYEGNIFVQPIYGSIQVTACPGIFQVGLGNSFGLIDTSGQVLAPCESNFIQYVSNVFWCQNVDLITFSFYIPVTSQYLSGSFKDLKIVGNHNFVYQKKTWFLVGNKDSSLRDGWTDLTYLNASYFVASNKKDTTLYATDGMTVIANNFGYVESYDQNRLVLNDSGERHIVKGKSYVETSYGYVSLLSNGSYYVLKNRLANYLDSNFNPKFQWLYSSIDPIDSMYAKVTSTDGVGLVSIESNQQIIAPRFTSLSVYNGRVKAFSKNNSLWLFSVTPKHATDSMEFTNFSTVSSYNLEMSRGADVLNPMDTGIVRQGRWFLENKKWGFIGNNGRILIKPSFFSYSQVSGSAFSIVKIQNYNARTGNVMSVRYGIVDEVKGVLLLFPNCTYIDRSMLADKSFSVVRVRTQQGIFDLIDKNTGKSKRRHSPFIDNYVNGRARIYIGGKLSYTEPPESQHITTAADFTQQYGYSLGTGYNRMLRYVSSRYRNNVLNVYAIKGQWNYVDQNGDLLLPVYTNQTMKITYASAFDPNNAVLYRKDSCALLNTKGEFLTGFEYQFISKVTDSLDSYYKVTRRSSAFSYYNKSGQKIGNVFEFGSDMNQGAAWVRKNDTFFILKENGTLVETAKKGIPYRNKFQDGYSPLEVNRRWTVVDTNGRFMFTQNIGKIIWSSEGYSARRTTLTNTKGRKERGYAVLDTSGVRLTDNLYRSIKPFHNGYASVRFRNSKSGFINAKGEIIVKGNYSKVWDFNSNGLCKVRKSGIGVISTTGKNVVPTKYTKVFIGDNAIVAGIGKRVVVFDTTGKRLKLYRNVERYSGFSDGLAMVRKKNKVGYINEQGDWLISPVYSMGSSFSNQVALVRNRNAQMVINRDQHILSSYDYLERIEFSEGVLVRHTPCGFQYYNKYGILISPKCYEKARPFKNGFALVMAGGKWGVINKSGDEILGCEYASIRINEYGEITANKSQTYGLLDQQGQEVVSPTFDNITYQPDFHLYTLKYGFVPSYLKESGAWLWQRNSLTSK
jgi:hypothetical protein